MWAKILSWAAGPKHERQSVGCWAEWDVQGNLNRVGRKPITCSPSLPKPFHFGMLWTILQSMLKNWCLSTTILRIKKPNQFWSNQKNERTGNCHEITIYWGWRRSPRTRLPGQGGPTITANHKTSYQGVRWNFFEPFQCAEHCRWRQKTTGAGLPWSKELACSVWTPTELQRVGTHMVNRCLQIQFFPHLESNVYGPYLYLSTSMRGENPLK